MTSDDGIADALANKLYEISTQRHFAVSTGIKGSQFHQPKGNRVLTASSAGRRQKLYRRFYMRTEFDLIQLSASAVRSPMVPWLPLDAQASKSSFVPQRHHRIDLRGSAGGDVAGRDGNQHEKKRDSKERRRIRTFSLKKLTGQKTRVTARLPAKPKSTPSKVSAVRRARPI